MSVEARPQLAPLERAADEDLDVLRRRLSELADERAPGSPMSPKELARYAHGAVSASGVRPGESLTVCLSGDEDVELAAEVATNAYLRGVRLVRVVLEGDLDPALESRLRAGARPGQALVLAAPQDALEWRRAVDEDTSFLMLNEWREDREGRVGRGVDANELRWSLVYWPSPTLERQFAFAGPDGARRLAERLLLFSRNGPDDDLAAYDRHLARLRSRAESLNELELAEIRLRVPDGGSELSVGLLGSSRFEICDWQTTRGKRFGCNFPTEEIFVTPDPAQTQGRVKTVFPLEFGGVWLAGLEATFRDGVVAREGFRVTPLDPAEDAIALTEAVYRHLAEEPGALRLGELALVGADSRVGRQGEVYGLNNLDEQSGIHAALGDSYLAGLEGGRDDPGRNRSELHVDLVLSRGVADVWGVSRDGQEVALLEGGRWALEEPALVEEPRVESSL